MALAQPQPLPYHNTLGMDTLSLSTAKVRVSRREEYQRKIVEKIKRHFDRRRKQWESNLQKQADVFSASSQSLAADQEPETEQRQDSLSTVAVAEAEEQEPRLAAGSRTSSISESRVSSDVIVSIESTDPAHLRVVHSHCDRHSKDTSNSRWHLEIDINSFLPDGEVLISTEGRTLTATGHLAKRKSRGSSNYSLAVKTQVTLNGEIDCRSMHVTTSTNGIMTIQVTVTHETRPRSH